MGECHGETDRAVDAHVQGGDVIEKDHSAAAIRFVRFAKQSTDHRFVTAGFVTNRTPQPIMLLTEDHGAFGDRS